MSAVQRHRHRSSINNNLNMLLTFRIRYAKCSLNTDFSFLRVNILHFNQTTLEEKNSRDFFVFVNFDTLYCLMINKLCISESKFGALFYDLVVHCAIMTVIQFFSFKIKNHNCIDLIIRFNEEVQTSANFVLTERKHQIVFVFMENDSFEVISL